MAEDLIYKAHKKQVGRDNFPAQVKFHFNPTNQIIFTY